MSRPGSSAGFTLVELLTVVAVASVLLVTTVGYSVPWMARQTMRSAVHDVHAFVQLTKIEAVSRNRQCRFVIDTASGALQVWDTLGSSTTSDDVSLHGGTVHESVSFDRPDSGPSVTLEQIGTSASYQVVFSSDGMVSSGTGEVHLHGGESFGRVSVHAAGGIEIARWDGTAWVNGS